jgi:hypothetical protein
VVDSHCLPIFREDGDGLLYQEPEVEPEEPPTRGATPPAKEPSEGDSDSWGWLIAGVSGGSDSGHETLKTLLRSGMKAIS